MTMHEFFEIVYPLLLARSLDKVEKRLANGTLVTAGWIGRVLRVEITFPTQKK